MGKPGLSPLGGRLEDPSLLNKGSTRKQPSQITMQGSIIMNPSACPELLVSILCYARIFEPTTKDYQTFEEILKPER